MKESVKNLTQVNVLISVLHKNCRKNSEVMVRGQNTRRPNTRGQKTIESKYHNVKTQHAKVPGPKNDA